ncbi:MAG TPA: MBL fold metallo-hydrolase [Gammaproteobacteria bacterium]|nr:MBL fold metallo-hydrolase [Gammaproteobacteria bacterium]
MHRISVRLGAAAAALLGLALAASLAAAQPLKGDMILTDSSPLIIHPISHATFAMYWNGNTIYNDPIGGAAPFQGLPKPDLILISHAHSDHFDVKTLQAIVQPNTKIVAPASVAEKLPQDLRSKTTVLGNGRTTSLLGISIQAVAAYNTTPERLKYHPKGVGDGYVLTIGGKRIYISGDTEETPEMRAQEHRCRIHLFQPALHHDGGEAVRDIHPMIVYPYQGNSDGCGIAPSPRDSRSGLSRAI